MRTFFQANARTLSLFVLFAPILLAANLGDRLSPNQQLLGARSDYLSIANDSLHLVMQPDCNLVLYNIHHNNQEVLWASNSNGRGSGCQAIMQTDGNFVVYTSAHQAVWNANSQGHPGAFVILQPDANLVVYLGSRALWSSSTAGRGFDIITNPAPRPGESKVWRIDRPEVRQLHTAYEGIRFETGDRVSVDAGGCVQTGGSGKTWKLYVYPSGDNAAALYSGTFYIPGVTGSEDQRIAGIIGKQWVVPANLPPTVSSQLFLHLGYQDDKPSDNGYYSHDDGTSDQCKNVGDAWLEIHVTKGPAQVTQGPAWSPYSKPFDLVWDTNSGVDANGLPLNPIWAYQITHPRQKPDFMATCGAALSGGETVDEGTLRNICTSQAPSTDLSSGIIPFLCPGDPLRGHLNWGLATYVGTLSWGEWSGNLALEDDDFNFTLQISGNAGLTSASDGLGLEFNAGESIDSFSDPWWKSIRDDVENLRNDLPGQGSDSVAKQQSDGKLAVVTGLFGLDCVHGCYTESHPVYAMAVRSTSQPFGQNTTVETWNFFIRNSGNEGNCSKFWHDWTGLDGMYYIQLPWPSGAKSVNLINVDANVSPFGPAAGTGMTLEQEQGWTYLAFRLAEPQSNSGYDGQISLQYTMGGPVTTTRDLIIPANTIRLAKAHQEEGIGWEALQAHLPNALVQQRFAQINKSTPSPWHFASASHSVKVQVNRTMALHKRNVGAPGRHGELVRATNRADPRQGAISEVEKKIVTGTPLDVDSLRKLEPKAAPR